MVPGTYSINIFKKKVKFQRPSVLLTFFAKFLESQHRKHLQTTQVARFSESSHSKHAFSRCNDTPRGSCNPEKKIPWRFDVNGGFYDFQKMIIGHTVDGSEIRRAPVEVGSLSHYLKAFFFFIPAI